MVIVYSLHKEMLVHQVLDALGSGLVLNDRDLRVDEVLSRNFELEVSGGCLTEFGEFDVHDLLELVVEEGKENFLVGIADAVVDKVLVDLAIGGLEGKNSHDVAALFFGFDFLADFNNFVMILRVRFLEI